MASDRFRKLVEQTRNERDRVRRLVASKRWKDAEPDRDRFRRFFSRVVKKVVPTGREALQGDTIDFQPAWFLGEGAVRRRAVAFVEVNAAGKSSVGTGFMISPQLFMTNQHVIENEIAARGAQITFDRETGEDGRLGLTSTFVLDPERFALFSREEELDYALIAVGRQTQGNGQLADFGFCRLSDKPDKHVIGMSMNIVQHPNGFPKVIAVRENTLQARTDRTLLYETDTDHGSSGAPVFNDEWDLVALHHYGEPFLELKDDQGRPIPTNINEGVRISAIFRDLETKLATLSADRQVLLREALSYDKQPPAAAGGRSLSGPRPDPGNRESATGVVPQSGGARAGETIERPAEEIIMTSSAAQELRVTIPIEVTVRVGSAGVGADARAALAPARPAKILVRGAEKLTVDTDYANRPGYVANFIPGVSIPLPQPSTTLAKQIAPLRPEEPSAAAGELKYQHFSVKMHKSKKLAVFTATNVDGETYLVVDRKTGEVTGGAEAEVWFTDPRISASFFLNQSFYSDWSHLFDRGHLTRRTDPTWGSDEDAERANADTFHFTNCSPQHFRFNQTAKFWQGVERYVLENGVLTDGPGKRLCVFQGPIFNNAIDRFADEIQIPSSFFKIVVWKGKGGLLKSVGLVVDQLALLDEERKSLGQPKDLPKVDVTHWRASIKTIEKRTGLSFGDAVVGADTFKQAGQPQVGEAQEAIKSLSDVPLT